MHDHARQAHSHGCKPMSETQAKSNPADGEPCGDAGAQGCHEAASGQQALSVRPQPGAPAPAGVAPSVPARRTLLPSVASVVQAGAFGAALGGIGTGVSELARVKQGEIGSDEAIRNVVKSSVQGATTMAVASVAGHMVRAHPVVGFVVLAAAGVGALTVLSNVKPKKKAPVAKAHRAGAPGATPAKKPAPASGKAASATAPSGNALPSS